MGFETTRISVLRGGGNSKSEAKKNTSEVAAPHLVIMADRIAVQNKTPSLNPMQ
jgi:hypothetical protein